MLRRLRPSSLSTPFRTYSTQPPPAGPFKTGPLPPKAPKPSPQQSKPAPLPDFLKREPLDPARGAAATQRVVREGVLDPRYKPASRRVIAIICAVPIFLVTSWVLFQRQFMGVEQKKRHVGSQEREGAEVVAGENGAVEVVGRNEGWKTA